jgi:hypothetical protein
LDDASQQGFTRCLSRRKCGQEIAQVLLHLILHFRDRKAPDLGQCIARVPSLPWHKGNSSFLGKRAIGFRKDAIHGHERSQLPATSAFKHRWSYAEPCTQFDSRLQVPLRAGEPVKNRRPCPWMMREGFEYLTFCTPRVDAHHATSLCLTLCERSFEDAPLHRQRISKSLRTIETNFTD